MSCLTARAEGEANMGVRFPSVASNTFVGPFPANDTETVVLITPPINEPIDNAQVLLFFSASLGVGAAVTSLTFRIRRGTTTAGTIIFLSPPIATVVAGNNYLGSFWYFDFPGVVAGQQYCLTVVQTAATGASVWTDGAMIAMVL